MKHVGVSHLIDSMRSIARLSHLSGYRATKAPKATLTATTKGFTAIGETDIPSFDLHV